MRVISILITCLCSYLSDCPQEATVSASELFLWHHKEKASKWPEAPEPLESTPSPPSFTSSLDIFGHDSQLSRYHPSS
uniref:Uncharacterized protein n=1 Tax=Calidris pygmaea TaxID=425635 RepID=A0A8C3KQZ3_9CHAR